ncbi:MAG: hypothetical protein JGK38_22395 [Microcoleus sp. PH2017_15_JOR_U_A]|uniref:hypothetical protein n=1 Tax=Microcoleus sp. PH2017_15_JOR_U_A TaxID=2798826 RepID=UPI001DA556A6|nr:hypothetical protein [Microcoleus sp. PH2017_15_JOR_U_A]MCC3499317.1 hypothetical protein [Microcoleus sp. PH2017_15_JOR_U_A]
MSIVDVAVGDVSLLSDLSTASFSVGNVSLLSNLLTVAVVCDSWLSNLPTADITVGDDS